MLDYLRLVVIPYRLSLGPGYANKRIMLTLDRYTVHTSEVVFNFVRENAIDLYFIPASCTDICQALDRGVNKDVKHNTNEIRRCELNSQREQEKVVFKTSPRHLVTIETKALDQVPASTITNTFTLTMTKRCQVESVRLDLTSE